MNFQKNASLLHKKVGETLSSSPLFQIFKIYQEYPVYKINNLYKNRLHKFDWVVMDIFMVIECQGEQHTKPVRFGGISSIEADNNLVTQKHRDLTKYDAAITAGFTYIEIPYYEYDIIDDNYIYNLYTTNKNEYFDLQNKHVLNNVGKERYRKQKEYLKNKKEFIND